MSSILLLCLGLFFALPVAGAAGEAYLTVDSAAGEAGQVVGVSVTISGMEGPEEGIGLSGGQFELVFNPEVAAVEAVIRGRSIDNGFIFIDNREYAPDKIRIAWAAQSAVLAGDGVLCTVTFRLKSSATIVPYLRNLVLYDQDLRPLAVTPVAEGNAIWRIAKAEGLPVADSAYDEEKNGAGETAPGETPPKEIAAVEDDYSVAALLSNYKLWLSAAALLLGALALIFTLRRRRRKAVLPRTW